MVDCFTCPLCPAPSCLKVQISPDNLHTMYMYKTVINCRYFKGTVISQGSIATFVSCGGIFNVDFIANLLSSLSVKEIWKSVCIWQRYRQKCGALFFCLTVYNDYSRDEQICTTFSHNSMPFRLEDIYKLNFHWIYNTKLHYLVKVSNPHVTFDN